MRTLSVEDLQFVSGGFAPLSSQPKPIETIIVTAKKGLAFGAIGQGGSLSTEDIVRLTDMENHRADLPGCDGPSNGAIAIGALTAAGAAAWQAYRWAVHPGSAFVPPPLKLALAAGWVAGNAVTGGFIGAGASSWLECQANQAIPQ